MALDREQHSQHSLKVMVTDQGHPRLNATATVYILVTDINDNTPQFTHLPASKELNVQVNMFGSYLLMLCYKSVCDGDRCLCCYVTNLIHTGHVPLFIADLGRSISWFLGDKHVRQRFRRRRKWNRHLLIGQR